MDKTRQIPSALMLQWEQEALSQKIPYTEFGNFIKMKERLYWQSVEEKKERPQIFANAARNKLTEYGNKVALDYFLAIPLVERVCKMAKYDLDELQRKLSRGFADAEQKENFDLTSNAIAFLLPAFLFLFVDVIYTYIYFAFNRRVIEAKFKTKEEILQNIEIIKSK